MKGLFVTATDTDVGKTWIGAQLVAQLIEQGISVKARKPIESGWPSDQFVNETDAWKLADAMGEIADLALVCPNRFKATISPERAAMLEGETINLEKLQKDCLKEISDSDFLYVEGAGGFYSPICDGALNADLATSLRLPVVLVVENRLGCINQALLNVEAIKNRGLKLAAIVLNSPSHAELNEDMDNFSDIQKRVECQVIKFDFNQSSKDSIKELSQAVLVE